ncbi:MAG: thiol-disulfide oxidoreductase DCC family protein [Terrimonas sp.]|nr:thiol-disulfide oxidoreductase DCC family protein [Terrimonas sp.]OJY92958.1 MAG: thiol-disulfide oxidoreductase [Sphingobacteriales bacterium 40-81]
MKQHYPVILFDGVCNLCNNSVQFVIKKDRKKHFYFTSLQSNAGQQLLKQYHLSPDKFDSFVLIENNKAYTRSTAALRVVKRLSGTWPLLYIFIIVPPFIRNAIYDWVAKNRYKWFGKSDSCMMPTPELNARFLH